MADSSQLVPLDALVELRPEKTSGVKDPRRPYVGLEQIAQDSPRLLGWLPSSASVSTNSEFEADDILLGKLRPNLHKSVRAPFPGYCSTDILVLRPTEGHDPGFVGHVFQREDVFSAAIATAAGTKMPRTSWRDLRGHRVFCPDSQAEQRRIASVLDTIDALIAKTEAVIAKLKQVRAGLLHDLLTRGLDANGSLRPPPDQAPHLYKDSPLGCIPREWEALPLNTVASVERGKFTHRPRNDPAYYGGAYPFIQTGDVAAAAGEVITEASQRLSGLGASVSKEFPAGTIAVTIAANIGDTAILGRGMFFPDSVVGVIANEAHSVRWVELSLRRAKQRLDALAPQSAQKNINLTFLRPLPIAVPPSAEQTQCSGRYDEISEQFGAESDTLAKLRSLKSGLMSDLLTGRVRVPAGPGSGPGTGTQ